MKKFFGEFKKFITRGNVLDMAVGVIVGSSFTAIVNAMSNNILKPFINYLLALLLGTGALEDAYTILGTPVYTVDADGNTILDLANTIYIDWGAFINAIINFLLIAFVLFTIVKIVNKMREENAEMLEKARKKKPTREERKEMKKLGIKRRDTAAVEAYYAEKARQAEEAKKAAEEKARLEKEQNPSTEELLKQIRDLLVAKNA